MAATGKTAKQSILGDIATLAPNLLVLLDPK